jgi:predicted small metal-binding protein
LRRRISWKRKGVDPMKTMTCQQLGGPCDLALRGDTADEVIKAQDRHLRDAVAQGDVTHQEALKAMKGRWKNPIGGMGWYKRTKRDFAALADD